MIAAGGTSWSEKSKSEISLYIYQKLRSSWTCTKCTHDDNSLVQIFDDKVVSVTTCHICEDDKNGK